MSESLSAEQLDELRHRTLSFVVKHLGSWDQSELGKFRAKLERKHLHPTEAQLQQALEAAVAYFQEGTSHLFVCRGSSCGPSHQYDNSDQAMEAHARENGCRITVIGCQSNCKHSPNAILRVGDQCRRFAHFASPEDWNTVVRFAGQASQAGSLEIDDPNADKLRYDGPAEKY